MPKKGTRTIQVNKKIYRWRVRGTHFGPDRAMGHVLTIENPDRKVKTLNYEGLFKVTPSDVREAIIEGNL
jgi:hypothetical protein